MSAKFRKLALGSTVAAFIALSGNAHALDFSFTGNLTGDDDVQLFAFSVGALSTVTMRTYSYAGGTQADGNIVAEGGFDPILALFDSAGNLVDQNDDGFVGLGSCAVPASGVTGSEFDTCLEASLAAGSYQVAVMQYDNFANGPTLGDGFRETGDAFFTSGLGGCSNGQFCDVDAFNRTNFWAFDILNVNQASTVSEPAMLGLFGLGLVSLGLGARRRKTA